MDNQVATADRFGDLLAARSPEMPSLRTVGWLALVAISGAAVYWRVIGKLAHDWANDGNYSHGFLIAPLALYFAWERRERLARTKLAPSWLGLIGVVGGLGLLTLGTLGAELFLARMSMLAVLVGGVVFLCGWRHLRILAFPIAFLLLMVPLPSLIFNQIAFPLQLLASRTGEFVLTTLGIPVLREGNVMILAHTTLEVAEACSGIRSLVSLVALGVIYGYFSEPRIAVRVLLATSTVPVAIAANALRVAGTGVAAQFFGPEAAEGFFHSFSGWLVFIVSFAAIFSLHRLFAAACDVAGRMPLHRTA
jgi:exosortase